MSGQTFHPLRVCRGCRYYEPGCHCEAVRDCPRCRGKGFNCIDDICHGRGRCMHGGRCVHCEGTGAVLPERVIVTPDETAREIRDYVREYPQIVKEEYWNAQTADDPLSAACYPMAEAYYHLTGRELDIYCLSWSDVDADLDGTHWYLRQPDGNRCYVDLGIDADHPVELPPYDHGTRRGFITGDEPSKRCRAIIDGIDREVPSE